MIDMMHGEISVPDVRKINIRGAYLCLLRFLFV